MLVKVTRDDMQAIIYRVANSGKLTELARTIKASNGSKLLIVTKQAYNSLRFQGSQQFKLAYTNGVYMGTVRGVINVMQPPHPTQYHFEVLNANRTMLNSSTINSLKDNALVDNFKLDYDGIRDNMLECIGKI